MKRHKLLNSVLLSFILLAIVLILGIGSVVVIQGINTKMSDYSAKAYSYTKAAAEYINGDKILSYIDTNEKDEYYNDILNFLNANQKNSDIEYYYVFIPTENDIIYVWDANTNGLACELGEHEEYLEGGKEEMERAFTKNPVEKISLARDKTYGYIASAYSPIFDSNGEPVAVAGVDMYMPDLQKDIIYSLINILVVIISIIFVSIVLYFYFVRKKIVRPINRLNEASKNMVKNLEEQEDIQIDIKTGNEIEELADSFIRMHLGIKEYIKRLSDITAEKERIGAELDVAKHIQSSMLPCIFPAFPERREFDIYATMTPAKEVGGDFYDFFLIDENHLAIVMADVSGKGVPAALFMVIAKTLIKNSAQNGLSPKEVFEKVNEQLCENNDAEMFVTAWLGILDIFTGKMTCVNAGHEYPAIKRSAGEFELLKDKHGFVLAGMEGAKYREYELDFNIGDKLFVYTDGVAEATDVNNSLFTTDRMIKALNSEKNADCVKILDNVRCGIDEFVGEAPQFDDITMLCFEYKGGGSDEG